MYTHKHFVLCLVWFLCLHIVFTAWTGPSALSELTIPTHSNWFRPTALGFCPRLNNTSLFTLEGFPSTSPCPLHFGDTTAKWLCVDLHISHGSVSTEYRVGSIINNILFETDGTTGYIWESEYHWTTLCSWSWEHSPWGLNHWLDTNHSILDG